MSANVGRSIGCKIVGFHAAPVSDIALPSLFCEQCGSEFKFFDLGARVKVDFAAGEARWKFEE